MNINDEHPRITRSGFHVSRQPSLLARILTTLVTVAVLALGLMFSAIVFVILALVGIAGGIYLWWKTRNFRKRMHEDIRAQQEMNPRSAWPNTPDAGHGEGGSVYEGEVVEIKESADLEQINALHSKRNRP